MILKNTRNTINKNKIAKFYRTIVLNEELIFFKNCCDMKKKVFLRNFSNNKEEFFIPKNDVLSLLLNRAVAVNDEKLVNDILDMIPNNLELLTTIDLSSYSPITNVLESGKENLLHCFKKYIEKCNKLTTDEKIIVHDLDYGNLMTVITTPQFENIYVGDIFEDYLKPLFAQKCLKEATKIVAEYETYL